MRISTNFCLSPFNQEPSYCDKILSKLDNYFYFGGKQVEIVGRNERTQEILCISSSGRHVPIAEKIIKILSYVEREKREKRAGWKWGRSCKEIGRAHV